jgi:pyruvate/2-oxoglutarate/acetoin dehydrogenase E1 component
MAEIEFRRAIWEALDEALARDETVIFFGEDVARAGGVFQVTRGLFDKYGSDRVFDTPISELALTGAAFGAAIAGLRPVVEIMFGDFFPLAMDGLVNQAAKYWYVSNEQASVPLVMRSAVGGGGRFAAIHSQTPVNWFQNVPGLKIVGPSDPAAAKALLTAAIRDDNPVIFLEHKRLYSLKGDVPDEIDVIPLGRARTARTGGDITIVTVMQGVADALAAADKLSRAGVQADVIDLQSLRPWDEAAVMSSVERTNRLLVVEDGPVLGGWGGDVIARVVADGLEHVDDAWRLGTPERPIPYSPTLEDAHFPRADRIAAEVAERLGLGAEGLS